MPAITAAVALLLSFAQAPFAHVHRNDPDHRHARAMPHSHFRLLFDRQLTLSGPGDDDDVQPIDWVVLANGAAPPFVAAIGEPVTVTAPIRPLELLRAPAPRAHDPPGLAKLPPRAPPA